MFHSRWLRNLLDIAGSHKDRRQLAARSRKSVCLMLEPLEDRITPSGFQTLYNFTGGSDGKNPWGGVILDSSGNLYGTTAYGGGGVGTLFEISSKGAFEDLYTFKNNSVSGGVPTDTLIRDSSGNLYGTTSTGGTGDTVNGTAFEYGANGTYTTLHSFGFSLDGAGLEAGLIMDNQGNLFGTTSIGSPNGGGAVFELSPNGSGGYTDTTLYGFNLGYEIDSGLVMDSAGDLYGTTSTGGASNSGVVYKLSPDGSGGYTYSTLHTFTGGSDGASPIGGLVLDGKGNLFGATSGNGTSGGGTVFKLSTDGSSFTTLYSLDSNGAGGSDPEDALLLDSNGNLYGTTYKGGASNDGVVFELSPNGNGGYTNTTLHAFVGSDGANPIAGLATDGNGNLYGTTINGGTNNAGTVFELTSVLPASTQTTASNASATFNPNAQNVTLSASVASNSATVNEGTVTFTILQGSTVIGKATTSNTVSNSQASVSYALPASLAAGTYTIEAMYNPGPDFNASSDTTHALTVLLAPAITSGDKTVFTIGRSGSFTVTATGMPTPTLTESGALPSGVTFTDNGNGTASLAGAPSAGTQRAYYFTITAQNAAGSLTQDFTLTVNPAPMPTSPPPALPPIAPPSPSQPTALNVPPLLALLDSLLGETETNNANGTRTVTDSLFGIPLVVAIYGSSGSLLSATLLGFHVPNWVWSL